MKYQLLENLTKIAPRRAKGEQEAFQLITQPLKQANIPYKTQQFTTSVPVITHAELFADKQKISCIGASFVSGEFTSRSPILNAISAKSDEPAITYNPISQGVCLTSLFDFPSVAINCDDATKLLMAKEISGYVKVSEESFLSTNVLVGNMENPRSIVFAHYDSIVGAGAIDNAGSVALVFEMISAHPEALNETLFVLAGSEEESFSSPEGCYGFKVFDREYGKLLDTATQIIVLDGLGVSQPKLVQTNLGEVFAIDRLPEISAKLFWMQNDQSIVMKYYHSDLDTVDRIDEGFLDEAVELLMQRIAVS